MTQTTVVAPSMAAPAPRSGGGGLRLALFGLVIAVPIALLAYVFYDVSRTGGVSKLPDGTTYVDLQAMRLNSFDQVDGTREDLPAQYLALDGQRVAMDGEMWVDGSASGAVSRFDLVYSISDCCLSGAPQVQHFVESTPPSGERVPMYDGLVRAVGTLRIDVTRDAGGVTGVYHLDDVTVEPLD